MESLKIIGTGKFGDDFTIDFNKILIDRESLEAWR